MENYNSQRMNQLISIAQKKLTEEELLILNQNNVSIEQYVQWNIKQYRDLSLKIGLVIAVVSPFIVFAILNHFNLLNFVINLIICSLIFVGLVFAAFLSRYVLHASWQKNYLESPYLDTVITRACEMKKINKVSKHKWNKISQFDFQNKEDVAPRFNQVTIDRLTKLVIMFNQWMRYALILTTISTVLFFILLIALPDTVGMLVYIVLISIFVVTFILMGVRYFLSSLIGYGKRVFVLNWMGLNSSKMRFTGKMATFISILFMIIWGLELLVALAIIVGAMLFLNSLL